MEEEKQISEKKIDKFGFCLFLIIFNPMSGFSHCENWWIKCCFYCHVPTSHCTANKLCTYEVAIFPDLLGASPTFQSLPWSSATCRLLWSTHKLLTLLPLLISCSHLSQVSLGFSNIPAIILNILLGAGCLCLAKVDTVLVLSDPAGYFCPSGIPWWLC